MRNHWNKHQSGGMPDYAEIPGRRRTSPRRHETRVALGPDILRGAREIALFLYDDASQTRRVYHLVQEGQLPVFRLGGRLHARRSVLIDFVETQEDAAFAAFGEVGI